MYEDTKNPVRLITCDFCGAKIDVKKYKSCPQCGATYGDDNEYVNDAAIRATVSSNPGMDACLGLYDKYWGD